MEYYLTNEEIEALKIYRGINYEAINQMLTSNSTIDISYIKEQIEENSTLNLYSKENIIKYMAIIKRVYELMQKVYYSKKGKLEGILYRGTNMFETERIMNEPYIDRFLTATTNKNNAKTKFALKWDAPVLMNITIPKNIPYINTDEILDLNGEEEYIISPFTIIKEIKEIDAEEVKEYKVILEKQELEKLSVAEREGLYSYIMNTSEIIDIKLKEIIELDKINFENYENIRKLEQLLGKYEYESASEEVDIDDINRINKQLLEIKDDCRQIDVEKKNIENFITNWKRNIVVYLMAECQEIEEKYIVECNEDMKDNTNETVGEILQNEIESNIEINSEEKTEVENSIQTAEENNIETDNILENDISKEQVNEIDTNNKSVEEYKEEGEQKDLENSKNEIIDENDKKSVTKKECSENIETCEKLLENIKNLISKQQNHAKVAGNLGTTYSALNNGFEMKKITEDLSALLKNLKLKVNAIIAENEDEEQLEEKLQKISEINIQISTLFNYLNNPKSSIGVANITRFDEMVIIEENELKKGIYQTVRDVIGEAELKKLKEDLEIIEDKSPLEKLMGIFTGKNKLDEIIVEQIEIRQNAIRKTLSHKLSVASSYSIHEIVAKIRMFINENDDDTLVENEVLDLGELEKELKNNFVISDTKVESIITRRDGNHLPAGSKKLSKRESLEVDTYRFLNKYGYDLDQKDEEIKYQDTMANEISRIIEYINSSNIL